MVINEVQLAGESASDEFIELYNPTADSIDISEWSIQYKSAAGTSFTKKNFTSGSIIKPGGYYIVAHTQYTGSYADMRHASFGISSTGGNIYLVNNQTKLEVGYESAIVVDRVAWGTGNDPEGAACSGAPLTGTSLNRTNGIDTDNNAQDFSVKNSSPGFDEQIFEDNQTGSAEEEQSESASEELPSDNEDIRKQEQDVSSEQPEDSMYPITGAIVINELLPNPTGIDIQGEWVELKNIDNHVIDLTDWALKDKTRTYILNKEDFESLVLEAGEFLVIERSVSEIALNNTGSETVAISNPYGTIIDEIIYDDGGNEGESFIRLDDGGYDWTTEPTRGYENQVSGQNSELEISDFDSDGNVEDNNVNSQYEGLDDFTSTDYFGLQISELLPNPAGDEETEEWIELYNASSVPINLSGVTLADGASHTFTFEDGVVLPRSYIVLSREQTNIALNNNGDEVKIWTPDGMYLTSTRYFGNAVEGEAYALSAAGLWEWTSEPTPGTANIFSQILGVDAGEDELLIDRPYGSYKRSIKPNFLNSTDEGTLPTIEEIKNQPLGTPVTVEGIVVVEPSIFAKTYFYINDGRDGIRIYSAKGEFPRMTVGDRVQVTGELSESNQELRLKISSDTSIEVLGTAAEPRPLEIELSEIGELLEGAFIAVAGEITAIESSNIYIDDGAAEARVYVSQNSGVNTKIFQTTDNVVVLGIISETSAGYRIMPRSVDDIKLITEEGENVSVESVLINNRSSKTELLWLGLVLAAVLVTVGGYALNRRYRWIRKKNRSESSEEDLEEE